MAVELGININLETEAYFVEKLTTEGVIPEHVLHEAAKLYDTVGDAIESAQSTFLISENSIEALTSISPQPSPTGYDIDDVNLLLIMAGSSARFTRQ